METGEGPRCRLSAAAPRHSPPVQAALRQRPGSRRPALRPCPATGQRPAGAGGGVGEGEGRRERGEGAAPPGPAASQCGGRCHVTGGAGRGRGGCAGPRAEAAGPAQPSPVHPTASRAPELPLRHRHHHHRPAGAARVGSDCPRRLKTLLQRDQCEVRGSRGEKQWRPCTPSRRAGPSCLGKKPAFSETGLLKVPLTPPLQYVPAGSFSGLLNLSIPAW